jgi:two-component system cell cycle sensor histidine kinase/response regulator CckA
MTYEAARPLGVLVADDDEDLRQLMGLTLLREEMRVWVAPCGTQAVELLREHGAAVDVALLDVRLPGLTGPQALARMRELRPGLPCVFVTGHAGGAEAEVRAPGCRVVLKPFHPGELVAAVREAVAWSR